ncbi:MAG: glycosyltransferase [Vulcanimicrobiaceae bacterium]
MGAAPRATIQLCTYNRAHLLERVLEGCFEQTVPPNDYEVVLVNDGSRDRTPAVIAAMQSRARCAFTVIGQANAGLARARNAGIARARGERIIFIDDDVLPTPAFVAEHLRSHDRNPAAIVRGAVINCASFDNLPPPIWSWRNYSANYFWTSNVSVPRAALDRVGPFTESFQEYGWEDIELGIRLRLGGVRAVFNRAAVAFHFKPGPRAGNVDGMIAQARAQARTARRLYELQPHWRVVLATGDHPLERTTHRVARALGLPNRYRAFVGETAGDRPLSTAQVLAARALAREAYFEELERARRAGR